MSTFTSNLNNGSETDAAGHFRFLADITQGHGYGVTITPAATPNMTVIISAGDFRIEDGDGVHFSWSDADTIIQIPAADATNNRVDRIVAYIDKSMTFSATPTNNPDSLKFKVISGTPFTLPQPPSDTVIQQTIGVDNPFCYVADVYSNPSTTTIQDFNIVSLITPITFPDTSISKPYTEIAGAGIPYTTLTKSLANAPTSMEFVPLCTQVPLVSAGFTAFTTAIPSWATRLKISIIGQYGATISGNDFSVCASGGTRFSNYVWGLQNTSQSDAGYRVNSSVGWSEFSPTGTALKYDNFAVTYDLYGAVNSSGFWIQGFWKHIQAVQSTGTNDYAYSNGGVRISSHTSLSDIAGIFTGPTVQTGSYLSAYVGI